MQSGVPVARIELLDDTQIDACIRYSNLQDFEVKPTLFFEFHGSPAGTAEQAETVEAIAGDLGGSAFRWTRNQEERNRLWQARHDVYYACMALRPGCRAWSTDVCVPISRLAECLIDTRRDVDETGLIAQIVGHVGDGNFHCGIVIDPDNPEEMATARAFNKRLVARGARDGRHLHRRTRRRPRQDRLCRGREGRGRRCHARPQTRSRPGKQDEPRQGDTAMTQLSPCRTAGRPRLRAALGGKAGPA